MKHKIKKCTKCQTYTLKEICNNCKIETHDPHPPKFSLEDKYIRYRIMDAYSEDKKNNEGKEHPH